MSSEPPATSSTTPPAPLPPATVFSQPKILANSVPASFGSCLFDGLASTPSTHPHWTFSDVTYVHLCHDVGANTISLDLSSGDEAGGGGGGDGKTDDEEGSTICRYSHIALSHARLCPSREFGHAVDLSLKQWVRTGVAIVLVTPDLDVLVTQRAHHMRSFPSRWVVPGGHLDAGESLADAGLREVQEETGVAAGDIDPDSVRVLALWESNYPIDKVPIRQHLVVYFVARTLSRSRPELKLDASEVATAVWVPRTVLPELVADTAVPGSTTTVSGKVPGSGDAAEVSVSDMRSKLAEGTRFALACLLGEADTEDTKK